MNRVWPYIACVVVGLALGAMVVGLFYLRPALALSAGAIARADAERDRADSEYDRGVASTATHTAILEASLIRANAAGGLAVAEAAANASAVVDARRELAAMAGALQGAVGLTGELVSGAGDIEELARLAEERSGHVIEGLLRIQAGVRGEDSGTDE